MSLAAALTGCGTGAGTDTPRTFFENVDYVGDTIVGHRLDLHLPVAEGRHKVVVVICGSAWFANNNKSTGFECVGRPLLERGFAVAAINHRANTEARYPAQIHDVRAAIRFLRAHADEYHLDPSWVGITGFSSGGHLAALAATTAGQRQAAADNVTVDLEGDLGDCRRESSDVQAAVDWFGPSDLLAMLDGCTTPKGADSPEGVLLGGAPADNRGLAKLASPAHFASPQSAPTLIIHGNADPVVPYCQSERLAGLLKEAGKLADFITVEGGGHGPVTFNDTTFARMVDFFAQQAQLPERTQQRDNNPIINADVPDMSMLRVGDTYYMSSTTMHMVPNVPIMMSRDLVNWQIIGYATDTLATLPATTLANGQSCYGHGTWASCLRYHEGKFVLSSFAKTTNKTYIFEADRPEGPWKRREFEPAYHDHTIFWDGPTPYIIWGNNELYIAELSPDLGGVKEETRRVLLANASAPAGNDMGLGAEGSQMFRVGDMWYLINICWPKGGVRTVVCHRSRSLDGPWEGRALFHDRGIAQGGLVDTPDGRWFAYLFEDYGSLGRRPWIVPVTWIDGWPEMGVGGVAPSRVALPDNQGLKPGIVSCDDFEEEALPLPWQWNHNPDNTLWSLSARPGWLRLTTGAPANGLLDARNTLTQRTFGPTCQADTRLDASNLANGDYAGLCLLQQRHGEIGVRVDGGKRYIELNVCAGERGDSLVTLRKPCPGAVVRLRADCDFRNRVDRAQFYYAADNDTATWQPLGPQLAMRYTMPHFMGYRYGLFCFRGAGGKAGGRGDFDYYNVR